MLMSDSITLTLERSNQATGMPFPAIKPHGPREWPLFSSIGTRRNSLQVNRQRHENRRVPRLAIRLDANQFSTPPIHELQYGGLPGYELSWPHPNESWDAATRDKTDVPSDLQEALTDLANVREEARIEEFPIPPESLVQKAERMVRFLYRVYPARFEVSADPDGAIAIDLRDGAGGWMMLLCEPGGEALVLTNLEIGERRRFSLEDAMLDSFLRDALGHLKSETP